MKFRIKVQPVYGETVTYSRERITEVRSLVADIKHAGGADIIWVEQGKWTIARLVHGRDGWIGPPTIRPL
jgi:hypothetical protein